MLPELDTLIIAFVYVILMCGAAYGLIRACGTRRADRLMAFLSGLDRDDDR